MYEQTTRQGKVGRQSWLDRGVGWLGLLGSGLGVSGFGFGFGSGFGILSGKEDWTWTVRREKNDAVVLLLCPVPKAKLVSPGREPEPCDDTAAKYNGGPPRA